MTRRTDLECATEWDKRHVWHPFTQMREWTAPGHQPLFIASGEGPWLLDSAGKRYLDGNSSIWTNIHGHNHPRINRAILEQLNRVSHASFLGSANFPAAELAKRLVDLAPGTNLTRVFYSDDGSTGMEVAIKMTIQYFRQIGLPQKNRFAAFTNAYHGDTLGASSLGGIRSFHETFNALHFPAARITDVADLDGLDSESLAAVAIEPLIQGAAGMRIWPPGMLKTLRQWCDDHRVVLICDEVMTGFGRTGRMFACEHEEVCPDFLVLAKGLTGGYLPLAATLTTETVYEGFLGEFDQLRTFFYGHSYSGNPLGCAAALASLDVFREDAVLDRAGHAIETLRQELDKLKAMPWVREIRQQGMIAGIELGTPDGGQFDWRERKGAAVCLAAREFGLLTRPIQDVVVFMPPLCVTDSEIRFGLEAIAKGVDAVFKK